MQERLVERSAFHQPIVQQENGAGVFTLTTAVLSLSVTTSTLSKALFGHAVARQSWMHARSVASPALGNAQEKERHAWQSIRTTVIQTTPSNNLILIKTRATLGHLFLYLITS